MTLVMSSPFAVAGMITFFAHALRCPLAFAASVKGPGDSITISTPSSFHKRSGAFAHGEALILWPPTISVSSCPNSGWNFSLVCGVLFGEVGQVVGGNEVIDHDQFDILTEEFVSRLRAT